MRRPEANWQAWVRKAEHDLVAMRSILTGEEVPWDVVCFHAQQAAEKLLKAFLVSRGLHPARTHDLVALLRECVARQGSLSSLEGDCRLLTAFGVRARYPDDRDEPGSEEARAAVEAVERVRQAIQRCLPGEG